MVDYLTKDLSIWDPVESINSLIGAAGIKIKMLGEDYGLID